MLSALRARWTLSYRGADVVPGFAMPVEVTLSEGVPADRPDGELADGCDPGPAGVRVDPTGMSFRGAWVPRTSFRLI
jgi:hypothetical protein